MNYLKLLETYCSCLLMMLNCFQELPTWMIVPACNQFVWVVSVLAIIFLSYQNVWLYTWVTIIPYSIDGQVLNEVTEHKDLGVVFDHALKFHSPVSTIVSKANRILDMIKRCFTTLNQSTLLVLYKHLVRTQLEYCNTVWNHGYTWQIWIN